MKQKIAKRQQHIEEQDWVYNAQAKFVSDQQRQLEQAIKAKDEQTRLATERQQQIEELTQARDAQAKLANDRQAQLVQWFQLQEVQLRLMAVRQARLEQAIRAKDEQAHLAAERQQQIEKLTWARDEQAKLASDRQVQMEEAIRAKEQAPLAKDLLRGAVPDSLKPRQVFRSDTRWGRSVIEWPSLDAFLSTVEIQSGVHSVPIGEFAGRQIYYDFLLTARPGTVLLCHFHGNAPREGTSFPPVFTGLGVTGSITTSRFVPSDPALAFDASLSLAWHFGCDGIRLQAITVSIVQKLQAILHAPRVVTWGGSGGGFAAIRVAKDISNSIAFVWNSQTDIAKYNPDHVNHYRRIAFPTLGADRPLPSDGEQFPSLCTDEFHNGYKGIILYLQERTDWHVKAHLNPFLASFCRKALSDMPDSPQFSGFIIDRLYLHLDHWGKIGHFPPSKYIIENVLKLLSDVTSNMEDHKNLACFPEEAIKYIASTLSQNVIATKM